MNWATYAIEALQKGKTFLLTAPSGNSMLPLVKKGDKVLLEPIYPKVGDIVLVNVGRTVYLHKVLGFSSNESRPQPKSGRFQIGNNKGRVNGWVGLHAVHGVATEINGQRIRHE